MKRAFVLFQLKLNTPQHLGFYVSSGSFPLCSLGQFHASLTYHYKLAKENKGKRNKELPPSDNPLHIPVWNCTITGTLQSRVYPPIGVKVSHTSQRYPPTIRYPPSTVKGISYKGVTRLKDKVSPLKGIS